MFGIRLAIGLPFKVWNDFAGWYIWDLDKPIPKTKWKNVNAQITWWDPSTIFKFEFDFDLIGRDHAGINFEVAIFGLSLILGMYDSRHWNYDEDRWEIYPGEEQDNIELDDEPDRRAGLDSKSS